MRPSNVIYLDTLAAGQSWVYVKLVAEGSTFL
jgi:hypothetical protein